MQGLERSGDGPAGRADAVPMRNLHDGAALPARGPSDQNPIKKGKIGSVDVLEEASWVI